MKKNEISEIVCSLARAVKEVGDTWKILILKELFLRNRRFDSIQAQTGMSSNSLATRLEELESDGIVEKRQYEDHPARYEYHLTEKGLDIWPMMVALTQWGDQWLDPEKIRPLRISHKDCDPKAEPVVVCSECNERLDAHGAHITMSCEAEQYREDRTHA